MLKKLACKIAISIKFQHELYSDDGLSLHYLETLYLSNPTYILPESFFEPTTSHKTHFFVEKVQLCNQRCQNTTLNSNK